MKNQQGFTLIELVVVIVILGILAAVAVPKFIDMRTEASQAAVEGVAGAIASAMAINYAACSVKDHDAADDKCTEIAPTTACSNTTVNSILLENLSTGYVVSGTGAPTGSDNGTATQCTLTLNADYTATFSAIVAGQ